MSVNSYNLFQTAQSQFDKAADLLELNSATREFLRNPMREFHFTIPIHMDNGEMKVFRAFRIQHNDARGPVEGGVRFHPMETVDTVRASAMWMTWKTAVVGVPLGGGNGGVICDPHNLSDFEQEQICRGWVRQLVKNIGPNSDISAPDIMTNSQHMLWMLDEYETILGARYPGAFTGKPIEMGGSQGRIQATGYGIMIAVREALKELNIKINGTTASFQGFGKVSYYAIELYQKMGGKVICVSTWDNNENRSFSFRKKDGINLEDLREITNIYGGINKDKAEDIGYEVLSGDAWLEQEVDILVPAAIENQITDNNTDKINKCVKIIAEGANGPTSSKADAILNKSSIFIIPDFLANAGGVICSYFEQVQNNMNYYWDKDEVLAKLDVKMATAYADVSDFSRENKLGMRDSAYVIAVDKVAQACHSRGWV